MKDPKLEFVRNFFDHTDWQQNPAAFKLGRRERVEPNFLDKRRRVYIYVISSKQRYDQLFDKVHEVMDDHGCTIEFRTPSGILIDGSSGKIQWHEILRP